MVILCIGLAALTVICAFNWWTALMASYAVLMFLHENGCPMPTDEQLKFYFEKCANKWFAEKGLRKS